MWLIKQHSYSWSKVLLRFIYLYIILVGGYVIHNVKVDPSYFSVQQSAIINENYKDLFDLINHPDTADRWFRWISCYKSADHKPLSIGKQYKVYFRIPVIDKKVCFPARVIDYEPHHLVTLELDMILQPKIEFLVLPVTTNKSNLTAKITFQCTSPIIQFSLGTYLRMLSSKYINDALVTLQMMEKRIIY